MAVGEVDGYATGRDLRYHVGCVKARRGRTAVNSSAPRTQHRQLERNEVRPRGLDAPYAEAAVPFFLDRYSSTTSSGIACAPLLAMT